MSVKDEGERGGVCGVPTDHSVDLTFAQGEKEGREGGSCYVALREQGGIPGAGGSLGMGGGAEGRMLVYTLKEA